ncbi:hypothetical protein AB6A40_004301 [Gnathostoma spinigerum]|uniref:Transthyretin-like family protein n=1 Tax=Gnathostoma spinigerum TaxID=75299 RepID=A0ABD6EE91_9BILA
MYFLKKAILPLGFDDQLAETKTDSDGKYSISGSYGQLLSLDVKMKIYTKCGKSVPVCSREITLGIPDDFVTRTNSVEKWFNGGELNMQFKFKDEETSCL